jgi:hypothetical protein
MAAVVAWGGGCDTICQPIRGFVADDDVIFRNKIVSYLGEHGMHAVSIADRTEMLREVSRASSTTWSADKIALTTSGRGTV